MVSCRSERRYGMTKEKHEVTPSMRSGPDKMVPKAANWRRVLHDDLLC